MEQEYSSRLHKPSKCKHYGLSLGVWVYISLRRSRVAACTQQHDSLLLFWSMLPKLLSSHLLFPYTWPFPTSKLSAAPGRYSGGLETHRACLPFKISQTASWSLQPTVALTCRHPLTFSLLSVPTSSKYQQRKHCLMGLIVLRSVCIPKVLINGKAHSYCRTAD